MGGDLLRADRDHRHVLGDGPALPAQQGEQRLDGRLVLDDEARGLRTLVEDPGEGRGHRVVPALAGPVQQPQAQLPCPAAQPVEGAFGEAGVPFVDRGGLADDGDVAVAQPRQMLHAQRAGRPEVEVDAGQPVGVGRQTDQHRRPVGAPQQRQPFVVQLDVHHDHRVGQPAAGDSAYRVGALLAGEQQDVVPVGARGRGDGEGDLHHHRHVHVPAEWDHERDDVRPAAGQGAGTGVRVVAERADALLDPLPGGGGDGPLAAEDIAHRARGDSGVLGDLGEGDHPALQAL